MKILFLLLYLVTSLITFENSALKQHLIIKHNNNTDQPSDVAKILTDNTIIIYKNNNKNDYDS